jgi:glucokinase
MKTIGIDIGGTKIAIGTVDETGTCHAKTSFDTASKDGFPSAIRRITASIEKLLDQSRWKLSELDGIGVGCTGPVDPTRGTIHNPHTLATWEDCNIVQSLADQFVVPVFLENDADSAAMGEFRFGAGRDANPLVMVTFGTGIGFSAIIDGKPLRGVGGSHPELGHIPTVAGGPNCYCGIQGCFESMASGTAIEQAGRKLGLITTRDVFRAAQSGDHRSQRIIENAVFAVERAAWSIAHSFFPQRILLGGGMMEDHFDLFSQAMQKSLARAVMFSPESIVIAPTRLGNLSGVIGAASLVIHHVHSVTPPSSKSLNAKIGGHDDLTLFDSL